MLHHPLIMAILATAGLLPRARAAEKKPAPAPDVKREKAPQPARRAVAGVDSREAARRRRQILAGTLSTNRRGKGVRIEDWQITPLGDTQRLHGRVYGHPTVPDGTDVYTTAIRYESPANNTITTRNTTYQLGRPAN